jgi:solute carrier family 13 (sodium-dependent dicarboxylate transporter), member 2/3/5
VGDSVVAVAGALTLFILPTFHRDHPRDTPRPVFGTRMLDWKDCRPVSWGVVLLLGSGFAIASSFTSTGLSDSIGNVLLNFSSLPLVWFIMLTCFIVSLMTELISNVSMANLILPIVASLAVTQGVNPLMYMVPVTLACSFAFMLPAATPPNAVVFSYNAIKVCE